MMDRESSIIEIDRRRYAAAKRASTELFNALVREHPHIVAHQIANAKKYKG